MGLTLKGRKSSSGSSRKATRHDDSLFGQDTVEVLLGLGEGPWQGLKDGASSFFVGDVPLLDKASQTPNISNFELRFLKGTNPADSIRLNLGGLASTNNVGLDLRTQNQTIVVQCKQTQIDYLDVRFAVLRLLSVSKEGGEFPIDVQVKVEVKPRSSATWQIPFNNEPPPTSESSSGGAAFRPGSTTPGMVINDVYRETYYQAATPNAAKAVGAVWFVTTATNWKPKIWNGTAWVDPTGLAAGTRNGFAIWSWTDPEGTLRTAWYSPSGAAPPPGTLAKGDYLVTPQAGEEVYSYNDTAWVGLQSWKTPTPSAPGILTINGLARQTYPKEFRIPVARINEPYDVRVTRISPNSTKDIFRDINFESVQEVKRDAMSFPDLALAWLTIKATDTFTSIPDFTGVYRGLIIPVPSNYTFDETTQSGTYAGIWDGSFKMAYTNNPAWHAYNFIMNSRYGKNAYYPEVADKWDYYEFGKHCDAHKFRFNEYITEPRSLNELINYCVGIAGGRYVDRGDGYSTVIWDADDQVAQAIFAPENTIEGAFTYSFTDVTERKNDFRVSFKNPELNYREDRVRVRDLNDIAVNGRNPEEFVAVGCRDPEEAVKRGRLRLATALTEKIICSFKTNRLGRYLQPFQVVLVADDQSTNVISGRVANEGSAVGTTQLPLRDQIYLEAGISYSAQFTVSDGNGGMKVVTYPLTVATPGLQSKLVLSRALTEALPEYAVFSIGSPKAFRITSIEQDDEDPDVIDITAIEVNRLKWAFVDGQVTLRDILGVQTGPLSKFVYAPGRAAIVPEITSDGKLSLVTTWDASATKLNRGYRVYQSVNGEPMVQVYEGDQLLYRTAAPRAGTYVHSIVAVGLDGTTESAPVTVQYIVANGTTLRSVAPPTNLRLIDEPEAPIFRAIDPKFTWDAAADPLVTKYRVEVLNGSNAVVHTETISDLLLFTYSLAANRADNGGTPLRQFTVRVRSIDLTGNLSAPINLVVSHPAPAAIPFTLDATSETLFVQTTPPVGDWAGTLVWVETTSGFNPVTTATKADDRSAFFTFKAVPETTYFVRAAAYDSYGKSGLNYAPEQSKKATNLLFDPNAPARPTKPTLTTTLETSIDGTITSSVKATIPAVASANLKFYEIAWQVGTGDFETRAYETNVGTTRGYLPASTVNAKARSVSEMGFRSDWSDVATITTAKNTTAPANPTNPVIDAAFQRAVITWTAPANLDLKWVEVWGADVSTTSTTPVGVTGSRLIGYAPKGQTQFWDTLPTTGTRTYWLRSVNTSDVTATAYLRAGVGVSAPLQAQQLAAGVIDATKMATSLEVPRVVQSLPTTKTGQFVTLESDGKLYRWDAAQAKYVAASLQVSEITGLTADQIASVNAAAVAGQLSDTQLAGISAAKIAGQLAAAQIAAGAISFDKFGTGLEPLANVSALPTVSGYTGPKVVRLTTNGKLYRLVGTMWTTAVDAGDIAGTIQAAQVAALEASKITGQLTNAQLAQIDAAKVAGQLTDTQIAGLSAAKLSGQIVANQLADAAVSLSKFAAGLAPIGEVSALPTVSGYTGPKVVLLTADGKVYRLIGSTWTTGVTAGDIAGTIQAAQVAALEASKITGQLTNAQLADLAATKISGQLTNAQIAAIDATKLTGAIVASQIADAQLTAAKFSSGIKPIEIFATLPTTGNVEGRMVYNSTDNKLYRYIGNAWTSAVPSTDITGTLAANQISTLTAGQITGQLTNAQVAALDAAKLTGTLATSVSIPATTITGTLTNEQIGSLAATKISGTLSDTQLAGISAGKISGQIVANQLADASLTAAKFGSGIKPVEVFASLPTTGNVEGRMVYNSTDNKLYRYIGNAWTAAIAAGDITGTLAANQIATLTAGQITGTLTAAQIASVNAAAVAGTLSDTQIAAISAAKVSGALVNATLAASNVSGTLAATQIAALEASKITGKLTDAQIDTLSAAKVSGTLSDAQLAGISAAKVSGALVNATLAASGLTGTITAAQIAAVEASKITGQLGSNQLAAIEASKVSGTLSDAQIAGISAAKVSGALTNATLATAGLTGTLTNAQIGSGITASKISGALTNATINALAIAGQITSVQITDNAITAPKILAGSITGDRIAANAITAREMVLTDPQNLLLNGDWRQGRDADWVMSGDASSSVVDISAQSGAPSAYALSFPAGITGNLTNGSGAAPGVACNVGDQFYVEAWVRTNATVADRQGYLQGVQFDAVDGAASQALNGLLWIDNQTAFVWKPISFVFTATVQGRMRLRVAGSNPSTLLLITGLRFQRRNGAELIVDGSIIANKIAADAVTAGKIAANAITAREITAGTITGNEIRGATILAGNIAANAITTTQLNANAVTTAKIATNAVTANEIAAGTITATEIASGAITTAKLVAGAVTTVTIASGAIVAGKIAADAVTATNIVAGTITATELAANSIVAGKIATNAVTATTIAAGAITAGKVAADAITAANIVAGTITATEIASGAITTAKIFAGAVTAGTIATDAVVAGKIAASAITAREILAGTITATQIRAGTLTATEIAANAITATQLNADAVTAAKIATGAVVADAIATNAVTATKIIAGAIQTAHMTAGSINADRLVANSITVSQLAANSVTATQIASGSVTTDSLAAGAITAAKIAANTITATQLAANSVTTSQLAANAVVAGKIATDAVTATTIAAGAVTADAIAANAITAGKIDAGAISAREIAASSIVASRLAIGDTSNIYPDPDLLDPNSYVAESGVIFNLATQNEAAAGSSINKLTIFASSTVAGAVRGPAVIAEGGKDYYFSIYSEIAGSGTGNAVTSIVWYSDLAGNTEISRTVLKNTGSTSWSRTPVILTSPATARRVRFVYSLSALGGRNALFCEPIMRRGTDNELLVDGSVSAVKIVANSITASQIAANTITANNIAANAITTTQLNASAVTTAKIAALAVTASEIAANAIVAAKISAGAVTTAAMTAGSINADRLVANSITTTQLAANSVTATQIVAGTITANEIAGGTITAAKIAGATITATQLAANSITATQLAANSVTANAIVAGTITATELAANSIVAGKIATNAVTATTIAAGAVVAGKLAADSVTATNIVAGTITATEIATGAISTAKLAAGAVTALTIASGAVSAGKVAADAITAANIVAGTITATELAAGAITADKIAANAILASKIIVADWQNNFGNPVFENGSVDAWSGIDSVNDTVTRTDGIFATAPSRWVGLTNVVTTTKDIVGTSWIPVNPGEVWYMSADVASGTSSTNALGYLYIRSANAKRDASSPHGVSTGLVPTTTWTKWEGTFTVPAGRCFIYAGLRINGTTGSVGNYVYTNFKLRRMASAELIVDGAVVADKIAAGAITAGKIAADAVTATNIVAGTITGTEIKAGSITVNHLAANSVTATQIAAGTITGTEIKAGSIATAHLAVGSVQANNIASGAVSAGKVAADAITAANIVAGTITATELAAGAITADKIAANAISAGKLFIGDTTNMVLSGDFSRPDGTGTTEGWTSLDATAVLSPGSATDVGGNNRLMATGGGGAGLSNWITGRAGETITVTAWVYNRSPVRANLALNVYNAGGGFISNPVVAGTDTKGAWVRLEGQVVLPANTGRFRVYLSNTGRASGDVAEIYWGRVSARLAYTGSLIVDGAIVASKLAADSVTANAILAGTITTTEIAAGTITANNIAAATITGTKIAGQTITAANLVANTITAGQIAAGTVTATQIAANTITANNIAANAITANELAANSVTAAKVVAGAIGVDQLAAGAIVADKIGVGLNTGNLLANSDVNAGLSNFVGGANQWTGRTILLRSDWCPPGMQSVCMYAPAGPTSGQYSEIYYQAIQANGSFSPNIPVVGGQRYEISISTSNHRCHTRLVYYWYDSAGTQISGATNGVDAGSNQQTGQNQPLTSYVRNQVFWTAPSNAAYLRVGVRAYATADAASSGPYCFTFAWFLAKALLNQTEFSPYTPQSATIIDGGTIAADSVTATQIKAGTITTDLLAAGSINVGTIAATGSITADKLNANVLTAANLTITGSTKLSAWASGTEINGGAISANSIKAGSLQISDRGISITGLDFTYNSSTNRVDWSAGTIGYINDSDTVANAAIPAAGVTLTAAATYFYWTQGATALTTTTTFNTIIAAGNVHIATYSPATGLVVYRGSSMLDGSRLIAASIIGDRIAAGVIQTNHMTANTINGDRITAGTITAAKIVASSITSTQLAANCVTANQIVAGTITATEIANTTITGSKLVNATITAAQIADATITSAKIGNLQVKSANIEDLTVGNTKIADLAVTNGTGQTSAAGTRTISVSLNVRRANSKVLIIATRTGQPGAQHAFGINPGAMQTSIAVPGGSSQLYDTYTCAYTTTYLSGSNSTTITMLPTTNVMLYTATTAGTYTFTVVDTNNASASSGTAFDGKVGVFVLELSK